MDHDERSLAAVELVCAEAVHVCSGKVIEALFSAVRIEPARVLKNEMALSTTIRQVRSASLAAVARTHRGLFVPFASVTGLPGTEPVAWTRGVWSAAVR